MMRRRAFLRIGVVALASVIIALAVAIRQPTRGVQLMVSPYIDPSELPVSTEELRSLAMAEAELSLVGEPIQQYEYFMTKGQWMAYHGGNMPENVLPDRNVPVYVLRVIGKTEFVSRTGVAADIVEVAVDIRQRLPFAGGLKSTLLAPEIDVNIADEGYPAMPLPEATIEPRS